MTEMNTSANIKKYLPHLAAVAAFVIVSIVYFSPALRGDRIFQSDMSHFEGMSKELKDYNEQSGKRAGWTNSMFSGMPSYQIMGPETQNVFDTVKKPLTLWGLDFNAGILFLMMLGFYVFMSVMGAGPLVSFFASVAYALGSYNIIIIGVGHITKAWAMAMMAPVLAGMILCFRKKYLSGAALFTFALGMQIYFNHIQITYYNLIAALVLGACYMVYAIREKQVKDFLKSCALLLCCALLALMPNSTHLLLNSEYVEETMRGGSELTIKSDNASDKNINDRGLSIDYAYQWSYGIGETFTLMIPDFKGGGGSDHRLEKLAENRINQLQTTQPAQASSPQINYVANQYVASTYWGEQPFTSGPVYVGAIVVFLSLLGFILIKGVERWWLLVVTVLSILISWGSNFMPLNEFLFNHLPLYNKFRTPSMILVLANVTLVITAFLALKQFLRSDMEESKKMKALYISGGITAGFCLLCALIPSLFADFSCSKDALFERMLGDSFIQALYEDRKSCFVADSFRSFVFIAVAFAVLWLTAKGKLKKGFVAIIVIGLASVIDLWQVDKRYLNDQDFRKPYEMAISSNNAIDSIKQQAEERNLSHYRVYDLSVNTFNDASTSYFVPTIGGYHAAKLQRYQDIIDFYLVNPKYMQKDLNDSTLAASNQLREFYRAYSSQINCPNLGVLNMLDARFVILPAGEGNYTVIENSEACGAAWFVPKVEYVNSADEEILALDNFNPADKAVVNKTFAKAIDKNNSFDSTASIELVPQAVNNPDYRQYRTSSKTSQLAVFSEIYYDKGWKAYIDGKESEVIRADYVLRALQIPSGEHTVEFRFEPDTLRRFTPVNLAGSILVALLVLGAVAIPLYKRIREQKMKK